MMLSALSLYHGSSRQLALISPLGLAPSPLILAVERGDWPHTSIVRVPVEMNAERMRIERLIPWVKEKPAQSISGVLSPTAYLCYEGICESPKVTPQDLINSLKQKTPLFSDRSPAPL